MTLTEHLEIAQAKPIVVIGASGQVALALARHAKAAALPIVCCGRGTADITDPIALRSLFATLTPGIVINAAAYTAVDQAEGKPASAFAVNAEGPEHLGRLCHRHQIPLVHFSTDYVFDGSQRTPYRETDPIAPLGVYGESKASGEAAIRETCPRHLIFRTAWVYGLDGRNFLKTMLRLGAERDELSVVDDQHGTPTFADDLAAGVLAIVPSLMRPQETAVWGTYHLTHYGRTTWFGFASEIFRGLAEKGFRTPRLRAISTHDYPTPARRPPYSVLDTSKARRVFGIRLPDWQTGLHACLARLGNSQRFEGILS